MRAACCVLRAHTPRTHKKEKKIRREQGSRARWPGSGYTPDGCAVYHNWAKVGRGPAKHVLTAHSRVATGLTADDAINAVPMRAWPFGVVGAGRAGRAARGSVQGDACASTTCSWPVSSRRHFAASSAVPAVYLFESLAALASGVVCSARGRFRRCCRVQAATHRHEAWPEKLGEFLPQAS